MRAKKKQYQSFYPKAWIHETKTTFPRHITCLGVEYFTSHSCSHMNHRLPLIAASELLIVIRGFKRTGKSSLLKRMTGRAPGEVYIPTTVTHSGTTKWVPKSRPSSIVTIKIIDVVSTNATLTTSGEGAPQGIVAMYDPRNPESVDYARQLIENISSTIPIALLTNFQDIITSDMHPVFRKFSHRVVHIPTSMVTNLGLAELSHWLELPLALNIYNAYNQLLSVVNREIGNLKIMFSPGSSASVNMRYGNTVSNEDEDGFWSDDDQTHRPRARPPVEIELYASRPVQSRQQPQQQPQQQLQQQQQQQPRPDQKVPALNDEDDLMSAIIQTTANTRNNVALDETEADSRRREDFGRRGHRHRHRHVRRREDLNLDGPAPVPPAPRGMGYGLSAQTVAILRPEPVMVVSPALPQTPTPDISVVAAQHNDYDVI
jgi:hypothetical protein